MEMILILIIAVIIGLVLVAAKQPAEFRTTRSIVISAPAADIFPHVNNLHLWNAWSPWAKLDPQAKNTFEGATEGVGAKMSWAGNHKVGSGSMTVLESRANEFIKYKLDFLKPMQASHHAEFNLSPKGQQTTVNWSMYGRNNFMGKLMGLIMNCDKMLGNQFEQGLTALKALVEEAKK